MMEILDEDLIDDNQNLPNAVNWSALFILWIGMFFCLTYGLISEPDVIAGLILLIISTVLTYRNYELGVKTTFVVIILGVFRLAIFTPFVLSIGLNLGIINLSIDFLLVFVAVIHYFTNKEVLSVDQTEFAEERLSAERTKINSFKRRFSNRSIKELTEISKNDLLRPEAIRAAEELLSEKDR